MLVPLALATWALTARSVPGHQARYQPFLTVAWTELPSLRAMVTPATPAPIGPSTIVSACPSESDSPAPRSSIAPAGTVGFSGASAARVDRDAVAVQAGRAVGIDRGGIRPASVAQNRRAGTRGAALRSSGELAGKRSRWGSRSIRRMQARRSIRAGWPRPRQRQRHSDPDPPARPATATSASGGGSRPPAAGRWPPG